MTVTELGRLVSFLEDLERIYEKHNMAIKIHADSILVPHPITPYSDSKPNVTLSYTETTGISFEVDSN